MATIKPFRAIHPNPFYADQLVFTKPQTESVAGDMTRPEGLPPLKTLLETGARQRPETAEGQAQAYTDINQSLAALLEGERLYHDQSPGVYVYEIGHGDYSQTGIWALTDLTSDIKTHELTFEDSVRRIKNFRQNTGLEGSPILITYEPDGTIDAIIRVTKLNPPDIDYPGPTGHHQLWKIENAETLTKLISAFEKIEAIYLADGHHRKQSAEQLLKERQLHQLNSFDTITALYMNTDELRIRPYNRVVITDVPVEKDWLFKQLLPHFYMQESFNNKPIQPSTERSMGMYLQGCWYNLKAKPNTYSYTAKQNVLDVSILQDYVLKPIFQISDPGNDQRLKHAGGEKTMQEMDVLFKSNPNAIGFTLWPLNVEQLISAADAGINLPPKSTWIDPKIPYGLLLYKHE